MKKCFDALRLKNLKEKVKSRGRSKSKSKSPRKSKTTKKPNNDETSDYTDSNRLKPETVSNTGSKRENNITSRGSSIVSR